MPETKETQVLVAGGGPVGMTLAIDRAWRAEGRPIREQVSRCAMAHAEKEIMSRGAALATIEAPGIERERVRGKAGRACYDINAHQYCRGGLNFVTYYDASPIIATTERRILLSRCSRLHPQRLPVAAHRMCGYPMAGLCTTRRDPNMRGYGSIGSERRP